MAARHEPAMGLAFGQNRTLPPRLSKCKVAWSSLCPPFSLCRSVVELQLAPVLWFEHQLEHCVIDDASVLVVPVSAQPGPSTVGPTVCDAKIAGQVDTRPRLQTQHRKRN